MCRLVETIKVKNGNFLNICFHNERMNRSLSELFGLRLKLDLENLISVPEAANSGIVKCRIEYDQDIRKTEFLNYTIRPVKSLKIVYDDDIEYPYKYADRNRIESLGQMRKECDDILIVKNGFITDSSYANIVFRDLNGNWLTPSTCLLAGTRRANLLQQGIIGETSITCSDINKYTEVKLINAMLDLDDTEGIPIENIKL